MNVDYNRGQSASMYALKLGCVAMFPFHLGLGLFVMLGSMSTAGCAGPQPILPPSVAELQPVHAARIERDGLVLQATLLTKDQSQRLLGVDAVTRAVVPLLFVLTNQTPTPYTIRREHFRLQANQEHLEPTLPGRAAT